jgi:hypothetical protein
MNQGQKISRYGATLATHRRQESGVAVVAPLRESFFAPLDQLSASA